MMMVHYMDGNNLGGRNASSCGSGMAGWIRGRRRLYSFEEGSQKCEGESEQSNPARQHLEYMRIDLEPRDETAWQDKNPQQNIGEKSPQGRAFVYAKCGRVWDETVRTTAPLYPAVSSNQELGSAVVASVHRETQISRCTKQALRVRGLRNSCGYRVPQKKSAPQRLHAEDQGNSWSRYSPNQCESIGGGRNVLPPDARTTQRAFSEARLVSQGQNSSSQVLRSNPRSEVTTQTGNGGKNIVGLSLAVPDDPTTGTYGGINRATYTFWRSQYYRGVTDGGAAVSAANIGQYMSTLALRCVRGNNKPDLWVADATYFGFYLNSLQALQRISSADGDATAGAGFPSLKFYGGGMAADVVMGGGISGAVSATQLTSGATAAHMWALNTDFIFFRPHRDRNFVPIGGERQSVNQDAVVKLIGWAGNMTSSGPQFSGVLIA